MPEEPKPSEGNVNNLCRCPFCGCCFCNAADLQRHMETYGASRGEHAEAFRRIHGRLEHGAGQE
ncbi:MAG: hypothetical protein ACE14S_07965 [Candidatus Bathyarchaeia archaeon]